MNPNIERIKSELDPILQELHEHPVYYKIKDVEDLQIFLEHHVYAVWDFMSILKYLQINLTCTKIPWTPSANPKTRQLINEIVLTEESDIDYSGQPGSHFEQYIDGMMGCNADTSEIYNLLDEIEGGANIFEAIEMLMVPQAIKNFVSYTFELIETNEIHKIAASFTFARENIIPEMFNSLVKDLDEHFSGALVKFIYYLERHIELDGDTHGPLSIQMMEELCESNEQKWNESLEVAKRALQLRIKLWDSICECIDKKRAFLDNEKVSIS